MREQELETWWLHAQRGLAVLEQRERNLFGPKMRVVLFSGGHLTCLAGQIHLEKQESAGTRSQGLRMIAIPCVVHGSD